MAVTQSQTRTAGTKASRAKSRAKVVAESRDLRKLVAAAGGQDQIKGLTDVVTIGKGLGTKSRSAEARKIRAAARKAGQGVGRGSRYPVAVLAGDTPESVRADLLERGLA